MEGIAITRHLNSPPTDASCIHGSVGDVEANNTDIEGSREALDSQDDAVPPVPFSMHSHVFEDCQKSEKNTDRETLCNIDGESPSVSFGIGFAAGDITKKLSNIDAARVESEQSASSIVQPLPLAEPESPNQYQALRDQEVVQESRSVNSVDNLDYPAIRESNMPSQSRPDGRVQEGVFLLPEAIPVETNAPVEDPDVGVAELIQPDQSKVSLQKNHACVVSTFIAAIFLALGLTITFTRINAPSIEMPGISSSFSPSLQPTLFRKSSQPSLSIRNEIERNVLQRNVTFDKMNATDSHVLALDWITARDQMTLVASKPSLFQRYVLAALAFEFSFFRWLSDTNECDWVGVGCDMYRHVIKLELSESMLL